MTQPASGIFDNAAAVEFLAGLRAAPPTAVGDAVSAALRRVAQAEEPLTVVAVQQALVAVALLVCEADSSLLAGAPDADAVLTWFVDLDVELNPARRQIAEATIDRVLLPVDNLWYDESVSTDPTGTVLGTAHRLRDALADFAAGE